MDGFFQSFFGFGQQDGFQQQGFQPPSNTAVPPASQKAIRQLPTVCVTADDLADPNNRECVICFESVPLGSQMTRFPCGHLFHRPCIEQWIRKHCTCPICRFELETDDVAYERGRMERMKHRKQRFHAYELKRMDVKGLKHLCVKLNINHESCLDKEDLVQTILKSGKVDIIAAPEPKEFSLSELRGMSVGKLKRTMLDSGVSYDPRDVIEKEDIVQIFVNSGRVILMADPCDKDDNPTNFESHSSTTSSDPNGGNIGKHSSINNEDPISSMQTESAGMDRLMKESVSSLRSMAAVVDVSLSGCIEKREMVERIFKKVRRETDT